MALCPMALVIALPAYNAEALVYLSCPVHGGGGGGGGVAFQDKYQQALWLDYLDLAF